MRSNNDHKKPDSGFLSGGDQTLHFSAARSVQAAVLFASDSSTLTERLEILCLDPGAALRRKQQEILARISRCWVETADPQFNLALIWAHIAGRALVVDRFGTGIWAGLPWFNQNWGRDTFIALPGILVGHRLSRRSARHPQPFCCLAAERSRFTPLWPHPQSRCFADDIIYNTADGTPWLIRELKETLDYTGILSSRASSIRSCSARSMDPEKIRLIALGFSPTAMLTPGWTRVFAASKPGRRRGDRAVEIQALWIAELEAGAEIAHLLGYESDARE